MKAEEIMRALHLTAMGRVNTPEQQRLCEALAGLLDKDTPGVNVWVGDHGTYHIPDSLYASIKFTKDGLPDRRYKGNEPFWSWVEAQESAAQKAN